MLWITFTWYDPHTFVTLINTRNSTWFQGQGKVMIHKILVLPSASMQSARSNVFFSTYMIMRNKIKLDLKLNLELSSISIPLNKFYEKWSSSGSHCYHSVVYNYIADICHNRHNRQWCTFSSRVSFLHRERKILAYFGQFWLFCCEFMHFLVYFYRPW